MNIEPWAERLHDTAMIPDILNLTPVTSPGSQVTRTESGGWHLEIPPGRSGPYRLAQLDDYSNLRRANLPYYPDLSFKLRARASSASIPGTWGFGFWNDPFATSFMLGSKIFQLPVLPNAAWFFFASPQNYLSLRDDLPAEGALTATFRAPRLPSLLFLPAALVLPFLLLPLSARWLRRIGRLVVTQGAAQLHLNPTEWHDYGLEWRSAGVVFKVDGERVFETQVSPIPPVGLVIWVDNQYAATPPDGRFKYGRLANPQSSWIEVEQINVTELT
jgi:hypothetical protein